MLDRKRKQRIESFLQKASTVHQSQYTYPFIYDQYFVESSTITARCNNHGDFNVRANNHRRGFNKCPKCYPSRKTKTRKTKINEYIQKGKTIHQNFYDYSLITDRNNTVQEKVPIKCKEHGIFYQSLSDHIHRKAGCPHCSGNVIITPESFIKRAREVHGDDYEYSLDENSFSYSGPIHCKCKKHGWFVINHAYNHTANKSGCPKCSHEHPVRGFIMSNLNDETLNTLATFYIVKAKSKEEMFLKIGITSREINDRFKKFPYSYETIYQQQMYLKEAFLKEQCLLRDFKEFSYVPQQQFDGHTECLTHDDRIINAAKNGYNVKTPDNVVILPYTNVQNYSFLRNIVSKHSGIFLFPHEMHHIDVFYEEKNKIFARKCSIEEVDYTSANLFLKENHIEGNSNNSSIYYGLKYNNDLVSIIAFGKPTLNNKHQWELTRYCTKKGYVVIGGENKLFKHFLKYHDPNNIVGYSNKRFFSGKFYSSLGFNYLKDTAPFMWVLDQHTNEVFLKKNTSKKRTNTHNTKNNRTIFHDAGYQIFEWIKT